MTKRKPKKSVGKSPPTKHRLTELFWTLGPAFTRWAESHMDLQGLTPQRIRLMAFLLENGPMKMSGLGDELGVTATNVTALVDALEKDGMVVRKAHKTDRRTTMIELTAKAEKMLLENCPIFKDRVATLFSIFSATEQEKLLQFLLRLREELVERKILEESDFCGKSGSCK
jgi:DNA-binding MarR family transcriptional regulator